MARKRYSDEDCLKLRRRIFLRPTPFIIAAQAPSDFRFAGGTCGWLKTTPAVAAGLVDEVYTMELIVSLVEARAPKTGKPRKDKNT